jgi:hypothetical protein
MIEEHRPEVELERGDSTTQSSHSGHFRDGLSGVGKVLTVAIRQTSNVLSRRRHERVTDLEGHIDSGLRGASSRRADHGLADADLRGRPAGDGLPAR